MVTVEVDFWRAHRFFYFNSGLDPTKTRARAPHTNPTGEASTAIQTPITSDMHEGPSLFRMDG